MCLTECRLRHLGVARWGVMRHARSWIARRPRPRGLARRGCDAPSNGFSLWALNMDCRKMAPRNWRN